MTGTHLTVTERSNLRIFRQVAAEARHALAMPPADATSMRIVNGYIENVAGVNRVRALSIPVRRAYLRSDPVNCQRVLSVVERTSRAAIHDRAAALVVKFEPVREELDSVSILNDRRVAHAEMFEAWIDAQVFFDQPDKLHRYRAMLIELGKAVEGIGLHLCERIAEHVLELDDLVADFLGEQRGGGGGGGESREVGRIPAAGK
jgi:hypothetical protein